MASQPTRASGEAPLIMTDIKKSPRTLKAGHTTEPTKDPIASPKLFVSPQGETSFVEVELGITKNLGNFETARIAIRARRPVASQEQLDQTYTDLKFWVESRIKEEVASIHPTDPDLDY